MDLRVKMKKFMQTLKQVYLVGWKDVWEYAACILGGGLLGCTIILIVMAVAAHKGEPAEYIPLGGLMAWVVAVVVFCLAALFSISSEFNLAISMGKTRKYFVPAKYLLLVFDLLVLQAVVIAVSLFEDWVYGAIYPDAVCIFSFVSFLSHGEVILCIAIGGSMLILLCGALVMRFSTKIYWVLWALWMLGFMGASRIAVAISKAPEDSVWAGLVRKVVHFFMEEVTAVQVLGVILLLSVLGLAASFALLRRQRVTG